MLRQVLAASATASASSPNITLRRTAVALMLVHANYVLVSIAMLLVVGGLLSQRADTVAVGPVLSVLRLNPMLLRAELDATSLRTGYPWRRRTVTSAKS